MTVQRLCWCVVLAGCGSAFWGASVWADEAPTNRSPAAKEISGREIFLREWLPNDPRSHGGDGLGPVFNETSCVACHNQGGVGGGGSESKNVTVISALRLPSKEEQQRLQQQFAAATQAQRAQAQPAGKTLAERIGHAINQALEDADKMAAETPKKPAAMTEQERKELLAALQQMHPGLAKTRSVVLHRSSTEDAYTEWRQKLTLGAQMFEQFSQMAGVGAPNPKVEADATLLGGLAKQLLVVGVQPPREMSIERVGSLIDTFMSNPFFRGQLVGMGARDGAKFAVQVSQRNTTALFGAGLIDPIPDEVLIAASQQEHPEYPWAT
ncbi:MAG TPA: di-heme oxidoredictase family protein, partial [Planctomycetaceae bacterium]|nr:di-heme oxidoredictase family protein [Planctomycetaceae bacterium]